MFINSQYGQLQYKLDGNWIELEMREALIEIDLGLFPYTATREVFWSKHGPVFKNDYGYYALRFVGMDGLLGVIEQWYQMGYARNLDEWKTAMRKQALPMFNNIYADRKNIYYVYNALMPDRAPGPDWQGIVSGKNHV